MDSSAVDPELGKRTLLVSLLVFKDTQGIERFLNESLGCIVDAVLAADIRATIVIRINNPSLDIDKLRRIADEKEVFYDNVPILIVDGGENFGFGRGHNENFRSHPSDYLLILDDSFDFVHPEFLWTAIARFEASEQLAIMGAEDSPSMGAEGSPRELALGFGNGVLSQAGRHLAHRDVEASLLLIRGATFRGVGMFDESIRWATCGDADLSLKVQQAGFGVEWVPIPRRHVPPKSFRSLPDCEKSSVLERNRARLFAKWGYSLASGYVGKYTIFDVFSDGIGDVFCSLLCIAAELRRLVPAERDLVFVNCSSPELAALVLGRGIRVTSVREVERLIDEIGHENVASIRSTRSVNYALPFNIYSLVAGALSTPIGDQSTWPEIGERLFKTTNRHDLPAEFCVLHLEFLRPDHHGRAPAPVVIERIAMGLRAMPVPIVVVGKGHEIAIKELEALADKVIDLQGKLSLSELVTIVSKASWFVGIDSFPFHIAQAAGVPAAVFFGSVNPLTRVIDESRTWPMTADLECLGCYHYQIEPGAPFCMRMNQQCSSDVSQEAIGGAIEGMLARRPFNYDRHRRRLTAYQARLVDYIKYHPAPEGQLFKQELTSRSMSELLYEFANQIALLSSNHNQNALVSNLSRDNKRLRGELVNLSSLVVKQKALTAFSQSSKERRLIRLPAYLALPECVGCACVIEDDNLIINCENSDPRVVLEPRKVNGGRFGVSITASSSVEGVLQLFWAAGDDVFLEERSISLDIGCSPKVKVWMYDGLPDRPIKIRIDPLDRAGQVRLRVHYLSEAIVS